MKAIGGYFELEMADHVTVHNNVYAVNSGRKAIELILRNIKDNKIYWSTDNCKS